MKILPVSVLTEQLGWPKSECRCQHCDRPLKNFIWAELNFTDNSWHLEGEVPEEESQGWFPIGSTCIKKVL